MATLLKPTRRELIKLAVRDAYDKAQAELMQIKEELKNVTDKYNTAKSAHNKTVTAEYEKIGQGLKKKLMKLFDDYGFTPASYSKENGITISVSVDEHAKKLTISPRVYMERTYTADAKKEEDRFAPPEETDEMQRLLRESQELKKKADALSETMYKLHENDYLDHVIRTSMPTEALVLLDQLAEVVKNAV